MLVALLLAMLPAPSQAQDLDTAGITNTLGRGGQMLGGGVFKVAFPRKDLHVSIGDVVLKPGFALGSYAVFKQYANGTLMMGDLVLLTREVEPVMKALEENGIEITALHNHLLGTSPPVWYMHYMGMGKAEKLAAILRGALAHSNTPLGPATAARAAAPPWFESVVEKSLGYHGAPSGGVLAISISRARDETMDGMPIPPSMGTSEAFSFQDGGHHQIATTGDFSLTAHEVMPVLRALRDHDIDVDALHMHMLDDTPHLFFMHFWAVGDPATIAGGLRAALSYVNVRR